MTTNRRKLHFADFPAVLADAERLLASGYDRAGNWSLGQVATHLAVITEMSRTGFPWYVPWPLTLPIRWFALPSILRRDVFTRRLSAPKFAMPPDAAEDRAGVERLRAAFALFDGPSDKFYPSPLFGRLTRDEWRAVTLWHCEHHLSFLLPRGDA